MSVQEREPWWQSVDGRIEIFGPTDCIGTEWGIWQLWYDDLPVIEGTLTTVCNYYQAEFYPG